MSTLLLIILSIILIAVSALCSGLNVALMSLDMADLKRMAKLGNSDAKVVLKVRQNTHLSLAAILFTNVAVISATSLVLSNFLNGILAGILSTLLIVVFGEILPQAFAVKYALKAVAAFAPFLRLIIIISYPVSRPLQLLLDKLVGQEDEKLHSRRELGLIISDHHNEDESELDDDEVEIVQNTLLLSKKRVQEIMTPVKKVYFIYEDDVIDAKKIDEMTAENRSRIPVFNKSKTRCDKFVLLKDLVDIDFDSTPRALGEIKTHDAKSVGSRTALDTMFRKFISAKSHMMTVTKSDKIVGIVTIEDLIEEIIGHEILDETDAEMKDRT